MRKREFEVLGKELLDVWALDVVGLLEFNNFENLFAFWSACIYACKASLNLRGSTGNGIDV